MKIALDDHSNEVLAALESAFLKALEECGLVSVMGSQKTRALDAFANPAWRTSGFPSLLFSHRYCNASVRETYRKPVYICIIDSIRSIPVTSSKKIPPQNVTFVLRRVSFFSLLRQAFLRFYFAQKSAPRGGRQTQNRRSPQRR